MNPNNTKVENNVHKILLKNISIFLLNDNWTFLSSLCCTCMYVNTSCFIRLTLYISDALRASQWKKDKYSWTREAGGKKREALR